MLRKKIKAKKVMFFYYDKNEDKKWDVVGIDFNLDGKIDKIKRL